MANYTVYNEYNGGEILHGSAHDVLETVRRHVAADNDEIAKLNVDDYARALIEDAPYFLDAQLLHALEKQAFESPHDRALTYLAQMPTSGVRIVGANGAGVIAS